MKVRISRCLIIPTLIPNSESWTLRREDERPLQVFDMSCLQTILGLSRRQGLPNKLIRKLFGSHKIIRIRLRWFGHDIHKDNHSYVGWVYSQNFKGSREIGKPPKRWHNQVRNDTNLPWFTTQRMAMDREQWRDLSSIGHKGSFRPMQQWW